MSLQKILKKLIPLIKQYPFDGNEIYRIIQNVLFITKNYSIKEIEFEVNKYFTIFWEYCLECYLHVEGSTPLWLALSHIEKPEYIKKMIYDHLENKPKPKPKPINFKKYIIKTDIVEVKKDLALGLEQFYGCVNYNIHKTAEEAVLKIRKALMKGLIKAELHVTKDYISREYDSWIGYIDNTTCKKFTYTSASELILAVMLEEIYLDGGDKIYYE